MIAFVLRETGRDPAWLIGAPVPQLGSNAGAGEGWLVVEGDESDRTVFGLPAEIAVVTNVELDHHSEFALARRARGRVRAVGGARRAHAVRDAPRVRRRARAARRAQPPQRGRGARGARAGRRRARRGRAGARAVRRHRPPLRGVRGGRRDDRRRLRPPPDRDRRDDRGDRAGALSRAAGCACSSSRTSTRGRATSRASSARRSPAADDVAVTDVYPAREAPVPGVTGKLVVDALSDAAALPRGCRRSSRASSTSPRRARARRRRARARRGRRRPRARAAARTARLDDALEESVPLSRFTTIGTGGPARCFARPETPRRARRSCSPGPRPRGVAVETDRARLEPARPRRRRRRARAPARRASWPRCGSRATMLVAGGGATNAVCLHRARDAGLGGLEFASAIPGTAGGGVRMNAGAYGGDWRDVLDRRARRRRGGRARLDAGGARPLLPPLGARARRGRRARCASGSSRGPAEEIKATVAELLAQRKATQPTTKRTFGSVFKNPAGEPGRRAADRGVRAEGPPHRRCRDLAAARELHRERGRRDVRRRARADGRGAAPRARAVRRSSSSTRCASSGRSSCRRCREAAAARRSRPRGRPEQATARAAALPARRRRARARALLPSARVDRCVGARPARGRRRCVRGRARDLDLRGPRASRSRRLAARRRPRCATALAPELGRSLLAGRRRRRSTGGSRRPGRRRASRYDRALPAHAAGHGRAPSGRCSLLRQGRRRRWLVSARGRVMRKLAQPRRSARCRASGCRSDARRRWGRRCRATTAALAAAAVAPLARARFPAACAASAATRRQLTLVLAIGPRDPARRHRRPAPEARDRAPDPRTPRAPTRGAGYLDVSVPERPVLAARNPQVEGGG